MKIKRICITVSAVLLIALSSIVLIIANRQDNDFFEKNIEALADNEGPVLTNIHMKIWWVSEFDGGEAIICTRGGDDSCD